MFHAKSTTATKRHQQLLMVMMALTPTTVVADDEYCTVERPYAKPVSRDNGGYCEIETRDEFDTFYEDLGSGICAGPTDVNTGYWNLAINTRYFDSPFSDSSAQKCGNFCLSMGSSCNGFTIYDGSSSSRVDSCFLHTATDPSTHTSSWDFSGPHNVGDDRYLIAQTNRKSGARCYVKHTRKQPRAEVTTTVQTTADDTGGGDGGSNDYCDHGRYELFRILSKRWADPSDGRISREEWDYWIFLPNSRTFWCSARRLFEHNEGYCIYWEDSETGRVYCQSVKNGFDTIDRNHDDYITWDEFYWASIDRSDPAYDANEAAAALYGHPIFFEKMVPRSTWIRGHTSDDAESQLLVDDSKVDMSALAGSSASVLGTMSDSTAPNPSVAGLAKNKGRGEGRTGFLRGRKIGS